MSPVKRYKDAVAALGCIITGEPAQLHHPREGVGMGQRESDWLVIPLSPELHRMWHEDRQTFRMLYREYQNEMDMLAEVIRRMNT